jgi:hypothetical protein
MIGKTSKIIIAIVEFSAYSFLLFDRFGLIQRIKEMEPSLRALVNLKDYEGGWTIVTIFLLLISVPVYFVNKKLGWIIKFIGLSEVIFHYSVHASNLIVAVPLIIFWYYVRQLLAFQKGKKKGNLILVFTSVILGLVLYVASFEFPFLDY